MLETALTPVDTVVNAFEFSVIPCFSITALFQVSSSWILDIGATCHLCANPTLLTNCRPLSRSHDIYLPDGISKHPILCGDVKPYLVFTMFLMSSSI